jgi:hypothetical protein
MPFIIEDEAHAEWQGEFPSFEAAIAELKGRASAAWDSDINRPPCTSWRTCSRRYEIIEQDLDGAEVRRVPVLEVSAEGSRWLTE